MLNTEHSSSRGLKSDAVSFQQQAASTCSICAQKCIFQEKLCVQEDLAKSIWVALGCLLMLLLSLFFPAMNQFIAFSFLS